MKTFSFFLIVAFPFAFAASYTCPSVQDLRDHQLYSWKAFNIDEGTLISYKTMKDFEKKVTRFSSAQYLKGAPEGAAECFYESTQMPYTLVYLASDGVPSVNSPWNKDTADHAICTMSNEHCFFDTNA